MTLGRIIFSIYALLFLALSSFSGVFFYRTYHEFTNLKKQEAENMRRFAEAEKLLEDQLLKDLEARKKTYVHLKAFYPHHIWAIDFVNITFQGFLFVL